VKDQIFKWWINHSCSSVSPTSLPKHPLKHAFRQISGFFGAREKKVLLLLNPFSELGILVAEFAF